MVVQDTNGGSDTTSFNVTVAPVNDAPVIAGLENQEGQEGQSLTFDISATDIDDDPLTWSSVNLPDGANLTDNGDGTATFEWTPDYEQAGTYENVTFIVDDGAGGQVNLRLNTPSRSNVKELRSRK